ncbi:MAG: NADH-quinone oxidoreductase subunit C [Candidatus Binatia bacterium]|nr:MAG: NADH-quinone oxidoreductase subunit C [Candidatus Binatia bacterium]
MPKPLLPLLREVFGDTILSSHAQAGDETIVVPRERWLEVFRELRDRPEFRFEFLMDLTVVDYLGQTPRFEVVTHLYSLTHNHRLRVKTRVPEEDPELPSLTPLWKSADWAEREAWDMFGIRFSGHPDLRRILLYEEFVGHPLRKDYPVNRRQPLVPERDPIAEGWKPT